MNDQPGQGSLLNSYSYENAGFDGFLQRSIDSAAGTALDSQSTGGGGSKQLDLDRMQATGSFGDSIRVGNIQIDGVGGKISIYDENSDEVVRIGKLDD